MSNWPLVAVDAAAELEDALEVHARGLGAGADAAAHEVGVEALVAGRHGVWMVKTACPRTRARASSSDTPWRHELAGPLHEQERRVALVEVPDRGRDAQRAQGAHAADAQDELLVEAHLAAAHVEDVADGSVALVVLGHVRVQQEQRARGRPGPSRPRRGPCARAAPRARRAARRPGRRRAGPAGAWGRGRGSRAPGGHRRRWSGGSSRAGRRGPTATNGRAMSEAALQWSPASTPRPPE